MEKKFMRAALKEALKAQKLNEIPVGAVVVLDGKIVARAGNRRVNRFDATAHAEVEAIRKAGKKLKRWNLSDCDLYVTLEPCAMCAGAIVNARIRTVYFGADDARFGCCGTLMNLASFEKLNHRAVVVSGILAQECSEILSSHFKLLRLKKTNAGKKSDGKTGETIDVKTNGNADREIIDDNAGEKSGEESGLSKN